MFINYGKDWQRAWDAHVKSWEPISPESDYNNLTLWTDRSESNNGKLGYVRADVLNEDTKSPIRITKEQITDPYPHCVQIMCKVNVNHESAYHWEPETVPFFTREWEEQKDNPSDADDKHIHNCNITKRYYDDEDSEDDEEDVEEIEHEYLYEVELLVQKKSEDMVINERHEITDVPRKAIEFANIHYTSDVFLKNSFRHEMKLPDELFPKAWMNLMPKEERK